MSLSLSPVTALYGLPSSQQPDTLKNRDIIPKESTTTSAMSSNPLGPITQTPNHTAEFALGHFAWAYLILAPRHLKQYHRIDHQVSPREDITKYGPSAVAKGKLTQRDLDRIKRMDSAQANSIEHLPFFLGGMIFATVAGVDNGVINTCGWVYTAMRVGYGINYVLAETYRWSLLRAAFWWGGNAACGYLWWVAGLAINAKS